MKDEVVVPTYGTLLLAYDGAVATVTLNRPQVLNALNVAMFDDLERVFTLLARDPAVRVVVLTGAGEKAFAAGADIAGLAGLDAAAGEALSLRGQAVMRLVETCGKPVIACVNGFALGGGCELALCCTFRIAGEKAKLGMPEVKLGLIPGYGGTERLPRLVGRARALKMLLTGEAVGAAEALRIGLVEEVVEDALGRGVELARGIAGQAPLAVAGCLEVVGAEGVEAKVFGRLCGTRDKGEGVAAFLGKRAPVWSGE